MTTLEDRYEDVDQQQPDADHGANDTGVIEILGGVGEYRSFERLDDDEAGQHQQGDRDSCSDVGAHVSLSDSAIVVSCG